MHRLKSSQIRVAGRLRPVAVAFAGMLALVLATAATPADVVDDVAVNGYHVDSRTSATDECVSGAVADARNSGANLYIVVLVEEPNGGATTFSGALLTQLDTVGTVFTVAPETVGFEDNEGRWSADELNAAVDESLTVASDNDVVRTFVNTLTGLDSMCSNSSTEGKSGWAWMIVMVMIVGAVIFFIVRSVRQSASKGRSELRDKIQDQIDAIANDILDLEDEVRSSGNAEATRFFDDATRSFTTASDRLQAAETAQDIIDLGFDLDVTIWQLDSAEAILDGNEMPPKPEKPQPPPPQTSRTTGAASTPVAKPRDIDPTIRTGTPIPTSLPEYTRRQNRSSSYSSQDLLQAVLAGQAMTGMGRSPSSTTRTGGFESIRVPAPKPSRRQAKPRTRGGGRRRG